MNASVSGWNLKWVMVLLGVALAVRQWLWMPVLVVGASMQPTLRSGQLLGVNKFAYHFDKPRRGDIVEVKTSTGLMLKRVVGLPGETVALREGIFYINGVPLVEPYVYFRELSSIGPGQLGSESYVIAGDNRIESLIAVVNRDRIVGRVVGEPSRLRPLHASLAQAAWRSWAVRTCWRVA
jgi:signal peptidase I